MPKVSWKQKLKFGEGRREEGNEEEKNTSPVSNPAPLLRFVSLPRTGLMNGDTQNWKAIPWERPIGCLRNYRPAPWLPSMPIFVSSVTRQNLSQRQMTSDLDRCHAAQHWASFGSPDMELHQWTPVLATTRVQWQGARGTHRGLGLSLLLGRVVGIHQLSHPIGPP